MYVVLDSSVIVGALVESEEKHFKCKSILEQAKNGKFIAIEPYSVLVEVTAAIKRRTGSEDLAERIMKDLQNIDSIHFLELVAFRAIRAAEICKQTALRGMDAIVVQAADEFDATLVSLDEEMLDRSRKIVKIKSVDDF